MPEMVTVPAGPPLLSRPPPGLLRKTPLAVVIGVPSGFTFTRRWLALRTILPAGAAPAEVVTRMVKLLSARVSAVMTIGPGVVPGGGMEPLTTKVSISVLLSETSLAGSVVSGPGPEMVTAPGEPPVLSNFSLGLPINTALASMNEPSGFTFDRSSFTFSATVPAGAEPFAVV